MHTVSTFPINHFCRGARDILDDFLLSVGCSASKAFFCACCPAAKRAGGSRLIFLHVDLWDCGKLDASLRV
ncbi:hypothetical protein VFPPC_16211 [Pochonia chlamydosporia 170]|uniref:Uncharacterized protein n=1 Tax=Pochonia chlamydosporia 170 TaxID=1380566 RepID=A0A179FFW8_METCM|nr:hypothetical protein VFPPC_16211 [Pochonia chlamydosporia 170]OAQ64422.1 hypothetical protein VFPPC_16211 [Pochonia chlamydosporia 170]